MDGFKGGGYFKIFLNTSLRKYNIIAEILLKHDIEVTYINPFPERLPAFCMSVPENHAKFEDSYNLVLLLEMIYGLQYVYIGGDKHVLIGTTDCILDWRWFKTNICR